MTLEFPKKNNEEKEDNVVPFPVREKPAPIETNPLHAKNPLMFVNVVEEDGRSVARFFVQGEKITDQGEIPACDKAKCEEYIKLLRERIQNTPLPDRRSILQESLKNFEYALERFK